MASTEVLNALDSLHRELEKLEPAIKHVETAQHVTQTVKGIPEKHLELLKHVRENDVKHKGELLNLFSKEVQGITEENKKLQQNTLEIQQQVQIEQQALATLKDSIQAFYERVEKIQFPERLDKLDSNVAGIMIAVQNIQGRLDNVERNFAERIKDASERQVAALKLLQEKIISESERAKKSQLTHFIITWGIVLVTALGLYLRLKR